MPYIVSVHLFELMQQIATKGKIERLWKLQFHGE